MLAFAVYFSSLLAQAATAAPAASPAGPAQQPPSVLGGFVPMILIGIIFYFILLRPQQKRAKEQAALVSAVRSGDEVVTTGGLHGIVSNAREAGSKTVLVKFAENVKIEVDRSAIVGVSKAGSSSDSVPAVKVS